MSNTENKFSDRLKAVRRHLSDMTQKELAKELGVGEATLIRWEGGANFPPADALLNILALSPEIDPGWLLTGRGEMIPVELTKEGREKISELQKILGPAVSGDLGATWSAELVQDIEAILEGVHASIPMMKLGGAARVVDTALRLAIKTLTLSRGAMSPRKE